MNGLITAFDAFDHSPLRQSIFAQYS